MKTQFVLRKKLKTEMRAFKEPEGRIKPCCKNQIWKTSKKRNMSDWLHQDVNKVKVSNLIHNWGKELIKSWSLRQF